MGVDRTRDVDVDGYRYRPGSPESPVPSLQAHAALGPLVDLVRTDNIKSFPLRLPGCEFWPCHLLPR